MPTPFSRYQVLTDMKNLLGRNSHSFFQHYQSCCKCCNHQTSISIAKCSLNPITILRLYIIYLHKSISIGRSPRSFLPSILLHLRHRRTLLFIHRLLPKIPFHRILVPPRILGMLSQLFLIQQHDPTLLYIGTPGIDRPRRQLFRPQCDFVQRAHEGVGGVFRQ